jgi:MarR family transcriptional regulator, multiple antibiotic resistance protein MarR
MGVRRLIHPDVLSAIHRHRSGINRNHAPLDPRRGEASGATHMNNPNILPRRARPASLISAELTESPNCVGQLLNRLQSLHTVALERAILQARGGAALEMSAAQYVILSTLSQKGHVDAAAWLWKDMSYDSGAMTRVIARLEAKDLIKRQRSANDRRSVALELTEVARTALPTLRAGALRVINQFLCDFSAEETELIQRLLARMLENARLSDLT